MSEQKPFFLNGERAMISLGPLTKTKHCPFGCAFCYVQDGFTKYDTLNDDDIINFLKQNKKNYNIIYVSGDTDSFAEPRTERALGLLYRISSELNCDLLFTTRATFNDKNHALIKKIIDKQHEKGKELFASISVTRYSDETKYIEPDPIPSPDDRLNEIIKLKKLGATTILAMRPFLPVVDPNDYIKMLDKTKGFVDIALGEKFYFKAGSVVENRVFGNSEIALNVEGGNFCLEKMEFDLSDGDWICWNPEGYEKIVREHSEKLGVIFSLHSSDAIQEFKKCKTKQ